MNVETPPGCQMQFSQYYRCQYASGLHNALYIFSYTALCSAEVAVPKTF